MWMLKFEFYYIFLINSRKVGKVKYEGGFIMLFIIANQLYAQAADVCAELVFFVGVT